MAQSNYDFPVSGVTGTSYRNAMRAAFDALLTDNSGPDEPVSTRPYMRWADTTEGVLKKRNAADDDWEIIGNLDTGVDNIFNSLYPIGTIYQNATDSTNPATLFGVGTWVSLAPGKVLVGLDPTDTDFNAAGKEGGSKDVTLTGANHAPHTHGVNENGGHSHDLGVTSRDSEAMTNQSIINSTGDRKIFISGDGPPSGDFTRVFTQVNKQGERIITVDETGISIQSQGAAVPVDIVQPYYTVYRWLRTA